MGLGEEPAGTTGGVAVIGGSNRCHCRQLVPEQEGEPNIEMGLGGVLPTHAV